MIDDEQMKSKVLALVRLLSALRALHQGIFKGSFFKRLFRTRDYTEEIARLDAKREEIELIA